MGRLRGAVLYTATPATGGRLAHRIEAAHLRRLERDVAGALAEFDPAGVWEEAQVPTDHGVRSPGRGALSGGHPAPLHVDHLAVDVAGAIRGENEHCFRDLAGVAKTL